MRRLNIFFPVPAVAGLGILLALSSALTGCGRTETESDSNENLSFAQNTTLTPAPSPTPFMGTAGASALSGTYQVKWCGEGVDIEPAFAAVVEKVATLCNQQNTELSKAGRFQCGQDVCTLRSTTLTGGPDHTLRLSVGGSSAGSLALQISVQPAVRDRGNWQDGSLFSCMEAGVYASSRLNARALLQQKVFEGQALCGTLGR